MGAESSSLAVYGDELEQAFNKKVEPDESTVQFVKCVGLPPFACVVTCNCTEKGCFRLPLLQWCSVAVIAAQCVPCLSTRADLDRCIAGDRTRGSCAASWSRSEKPTTPACWARIVSNLQA
jgi:hypothetical protein